MLLIEDALDLRQWVLRTDVAGRPLGWIDYRDAVRLYHAGQVAYHCGRPLFRIRGGICALTGHRSEVDVNTIVATQGVSAGLNKRLDNYTPPLNNHTLFRRDAQICMYCGGRFLRRDLTRDHVRPISQGGSDVWANVVAACKRCNNFKGGRLPEDAGMQLLAVPFVPTYAEYIYLKGRRVLADQMEFLKAHFPRDSRLQSRFEQAA
ncbi:MAG: HNH endonuclease [Gammaproteobacteria bacterium]|nr:HNH endonuclease [Gammaproteobacteria bacterium]MYF68023.1 HNH endonuclease [Gammaproteobacteria bacterium]MYK37695.1 HNH endonuclease [Gammaproteobacteria bacterium]